MRIWNVVVWIEGWREVIEIEAADEDAARWAAAQRPGVSLVAGVW